MNKIHIMAIICAFLLLNGVFESCANNSVKKEEAKEQDSTPGLHQIR